MYHYETERPVIFTDEGQRMFLQIRDRVQQLLKESGAFKMEAAISGCTGSSWSMLACVDRLVELGEIREIEQFYRHAGQDRIFVAKR